MSKKCPRWLVASVSSNPSVEKLACLPVMDRLCVVDGKRAADSPSPVMWPADCRTAAKEARSSEIDSTLEVLASSADIRSMAYALVCWLREAGG